MTRFWGHSIAAAALSSTPPAAPPTSTRTAAWRSYYHILHPWKYYIVLQKYLVTWDRSNADTRQDTGPGHLHTTLHHVISHMAPGYSYGVQLTLYLCSEGQCQNDALFWSGHFYTDGQNQLWAAQFLALTESHRGQNVAHQETSKLDVFTISCHKYLDSWPGCRCVYLRSVLAGNGSTSLLDGGDWDNWTLDTI